MIENIKDLSVEAQVVYGGMWMLPICENSEVTFQRPWVIHPRTRKGLDELVENGFLIVEPFNKISPALTWKPTAKMTAKRVQLPWKFLEENSFPVTDESLDTEENRP